MIRPLLLSFSILLLVTGCGATAAKTPVSPQLQTAIATSDPLAIADALEALIDEGKATEHDRQVAYETLRDAQMPTAQYAFARAMVTGRLAQVKGLAGAMLAREMESWAETARKLDSAFRDGGATRMLGTLYVLAPSSVLAHGDSEKGLEMLEKNRKDYPNAIENHLRYAEALIALNDAGSATEALCKCRAEKAKLRKDDQALLDKLFQDAGSPTCPAAP